MLNMIQPNIQPSLNQSPNMMPQGTMSQGGSSSILGNLPQDVIKKVLKSVSQTVSMQASQAIEQGIPWGHVINELVKMAPPGVSMMGGGSPPPGGPQDPNGGGNKPPQPPQGGVSQEDSMVPQGIATQSNSPQMTQGKLRQSPYQQGRNGFAPQETNLGQLLTSQATNQQTQGINSPNGFFQGASIDQSGNLNQEGIGNQILRMLTGISGNSNNQALNQAGGVYDLQAKKQKVTGTEPIQPYQQLQQDTELAKNKASITKDSLARRDAFFKNINEPLSSAKDLSLVESALTGIDDITKLLDIKSDQNGNVSVGNSGLLKDVNFLNKNRQQLQRARDLYINKTLRRDSGAAIGKKEEDDFKKIIGFDIGMKSFMQNPKVIAKAMLESKDQLVRDRNRLSPNEKQRSLVQGFRDRGIKDSEIYSYLQSKGEV